jgi:hypothetical protein
VFYFDNGYIRGFEKAVFRRFALVLEDWVSSS